MLNLLSMYGLVRRLWADEDGASATEYAILVALVGAAVVVAVGLFGAGLSTIFTSLVTKMEGWIS